MDNSKILDTEAILKQIKTDLEVVNKSFNKAKCETDLLNYEKQINKDGFWNDASAAGEVLKSYNNLKSYFERINSLNARYEDLILLHNMAAVENDADLIKECLLEAQNLLNVLALEKINALFDKEIYKNNAYLEIHAGSGGVDAQDFASMLLRMYIRWAESNNFKAQEIDSSKAEVAGIKSCVLKIEGLYAYGNLISEQGVHRLVRISPFNAEGKRQTGFCAVNVYPEIIAEDNIKIEDKDIRVDTYKSSGAGGQHVNTTDSAVRITHIPSGIIVQSQAERSQHRNKDTAMSLLHAKLHQLYDDKKKEEQKANYNSRMDIDFGSQIRSYILNPHSMVKDHRTNVESYNPRAVFDGELRDFILAYLVFIKN
ncbi:MAG: peptide chain release factor 2 [Alphaproteobacteria bacterium]|nr:peptide chain release factor 2 [Alphaproteobacteria bacterium]